MKYLMLLFTVILFAACEGDTTHSESILEGVDTTGMTAEQVDSLKRMKEEEEMGAHILEGVLVR